MEENKDEMALVEVSNDLPMEFDENAVTGKEDFDSSCLSLPYLKISQDKSDARNKMKPGYIPGLEAGAFFCPLTRRVYGNSGRFVFLKFYRSFSVYDGEGMSSKRIGTLSVAQYEALKADPSMGIHRATKADGSNRGYDLDAQGHRYVDVRTFLAMNYDHPEDGIMLFPMSGTGVKPSRTLSTMLNAQKAKKVLPDGTVVFVDAPFWTSVWNLKIDYFQKPEGDYYQVSVVERLGWVKKGPIAEMYKKAFESVLDYGVGTIQGVGDEDEDVKPAEGASDAAAPEVAAVMGAMGAKPAKAPAKPAANGEEEELF
jgi:hypothetical protein